MPSCSPPPITMLAFEGMQSLDLVGPYEVFRGAGYPVAIRSLGGDHVRTESGLTLAAKSGPDPDMIHTLLIPGGAGTRRLQHHGPTMTAIRKLVGRADRIMCVCTGAFLAAAAGLLDGRTVTTHWAHAQELAATYPMITVDPDPIFLHDGPVWTSAGVTAGIDLALAVVEEDCGSEAAQIVARQLVMFLRRPGGQSQFAAPVWTDRAESSSLRLAQERIEADPGGDHSVAALALSAGMSERHFSRLFRIETGSTPGRYVATVRLEAARRDLETTDHTVDVIADRRGFGTAETMRRTFTRHLGVSPDQYRRRFRLPTRS